MRWEGREESQNIEDRRRLTPGGMVVGGGLGTAVLLLLLMCLGADPRTLMQQQQQQGGGVVVGPDGAPAAPGQDGQPDPQAKLRSFVGVVMKDLEDVWNDLLPKAVGVPYEEPKLVLFTGAVRSACGNASAAVGPFYCPGDRQVYIDLDFYQELQDKFGAAGDFAQAYVIAHEVGHHIQNLLGISEQTQRLMRGLPEVRANDISIRVELQADYLAGVWAHHAQAQKQILERGDVEEGLNAAQAIGDDKLQKMSAGVVMPEKFTHGSSAQRVRWFRKGLETGALNKQILQQFFEADEL